MIAATLAPAHEMQCCEAMRAMRGVLAVVRSAVATPMSHLALVVALAAPLGGCQDGGADDVPTDCHLDCFGGATCTAGVIHVYGFGARPVACDAPIVANACDKSTVTCALGCRAEVTVGGGPNSSGSDPYAWLCLAETPARVGDACVTDDDCHPTFAIPDSGGNLRQTYLRCDGASTCEVASPPTVTGYGEPCAPGPVVSFDVTWTAGATAGDVCLAVDRGCLRTFASRTCAGDWDCPQGSRCDDTIPHAGGAAGTGVCHPRAMLEAADLPCAPASP